ncbi:MAG: hypothetical protein ISS49_18425 [Anaerolineae bacterium]|nr:hypothetical protein [Anaerolineae bacterium]
MLDRLAGKETPALAAELVVGLAGCGMAARAITLLAIPDNIGVQLRVFADERNHLVTPVG